jgi:hypothetical protein
MGPLKRLHTSTNLHGIISQKQSAISAIAKIKNIRLTPQRNVTPEKQEKKELKPIDVCPNKSHTKGAFKIKVLLPTIFHSQEGQNGV